MPPSDPATTFAVSTRPASENSDLHISSFNDLVSLAREWHKKAHREYCERSTWPWQCGCPTVFRPHAASTVILLAISVVSIPTTILQGCGWDVTIAVAILCLTLASIAEWDAIDRFHNPSQTLTTIQLIRRFLIATVGNTCDFLASKKNEWERKKRPTLKRRIAKFRRMHKLPRNPTHLRADELCALLEDGALVELSLLLDLEKELLLGDKRIANTTKSAAHLRRCLHTFIHETVKESRNRDTLAEAATVILMGCAAVRKQALGAE